MENYFKYFITTSIAILLTIACMLLGIMCTHAQGNKPVMQRAPANVNVDGMIKEWGDSLVLYNDKAKINYTIANDDTDLYVVVFAADRQVKHKIMANGITVSVNAEGKTHKTYNLTYPMPDKGAIFKRPINGDDDVDENKPPSLLQSTSIKVAGFKDVESDVITTANTYGFKAAVKFDDKHNLGYEIAIPLKFLYLKKGKNNDLAINIAINGVEPQQNRRSESDSSEGIGGSGGGFGGGGGRTGGGGGRGGGRGGRGGGAGNQARPDQAGMGQTEDFWVKLALAPQ